MLQYPRMLETSRTYSIDMDTDYKRPKYYYLPNHVVETIENASLEIDLRERYIGDRGAAVLTKSSKIFQITSLNLESNGLGNRGTIIIANVLQHTQIKTLNLGNNKIGNRGAEAIADVLKDTGIISLNFERNRIGYRGAQAIASILRNTRITDLNLGYNGINKRGAVSIAKSLKNSQITSLNLQGNIIANRGAEAIAGVLVDTKIKYLNLYLCGIGNRGAGAISNALKYTQITSLDFESEEVVWVRPDFLKDARINKCSVTDLTPSHKPKAFVSTFKFPPIPHDGPAVIEKSLIELKGICYYKSCQFFREEETASLLDLQNYQIEDEGFRDFIDVLEICGVVDLYLLHGEMISKNITFLGIVGDGGWERYIEDKGAIAIAKILKHTQITSLHLESTRIEDDGCVAIANALKGSRITYLNFRSNYIGHVGAVAISHLLEDSQITYLNMYDNRIRDEGIIAIGKVLKHTRITDLNIGRNGIGNRGAIALADDLKGTQILSLKLNDCFIQDEGAIAIAGVLSETQITSFKFKDTQMGELGALAFASILNDTPITILDLDCKVTSELLNTITLMTKTNQLKERRLFTQFKNSVSSKNDSLEFIIRDEGAEPSQYIKLTKIISHKKQSHLSHFITMWNTPSINNQLENFIGNIELKLAEFFSKLDTTFIDRVKILLSCEEQGLGLVVKQLLVHRPNYLLIKYGAIEILHPTVCVLMNKYDEAWYFQNMKPTKMDLIEIFESSEWDDLIQEDQFKEFSCDYSKKRLLEILAEDCE